MHHDNMSLKTKPPFKGCSPPFLLGALGSAHPIGFQTCVVSRSLSEKTCGVDRTRNCPRDNVHKRLAERPQGLILVCSPTQAPQLTLPPSSIPAGMTSASQQQPCRPVPEPSFLGQEVLSPSGHYPFIRISMAALRWVGDLGLHGWVIMQSEWVMVPRDDPLKPEI